MLCYVQDRISHLEITLPKVNGKYFAVPRHTYESVCVCVCEHTHTHFQPCVYVYKNGRSETDIWGVKDMFSLKAY